jgi:hypothetical protein
MQAGRLHGSMQAGRLHHEDQSDNHKGGSF